MNPVVARRLSATLIPCILLVLIGLRFVHLDADFPLGITWSGDLYTDEGWYANAATRDVISGHWYQPGDFNPAVNLPVGQLLQRAVFGMFGPGLIAVRLSAAVASSLVILLAGLFVYRGSDAARSARLQAALLTALVLASSYFGFAFSRLAILEPIGMAFVMAALVLAQRADGGRALPWLILSALMLVAAVLVKGTMVFAIPVAAYAAWFNGRGRRQRALFVATVLLTSIAAIAGWQFVARHFFETDYTYFNRINLQARQVTGIGDWLANLHRQYVNMLRLGRPFVHLSLFLVVLAGVLCADFRSMPAVRILIAWALAYFGLLSIVSYGPPRYFVPMLVPLAGLSAMACVELAGWGRQQGRHRPLALLPALLPALLMVLVVCSGCVRIASYMARPHYSFLHMMAAVGRIIGQRDGGLSHAVLLGQMADSVSLEDRVRAVNTDMGTLSLAARLQRYRPSYVLIHTDGAQVLGAIRRSGGTTTKLGAWDVFANYYGAGQDIQLLAVNWSRPPQPSPR